MGFNIFYYIKSPMKIKKVDNNEKKNLYKRELELGETEEKALKLATMDHLPGIFQIYDLLTIVYGISTEKEATQRRAKIRYILEVRSE